MAKLLVVVEVEAVVVLVVEDETGAEVALTVAAADSALCILIIFVHSDARRSFTPVATLGLLKPKVLNLGSNRVATASELCLSFSWSLSTKHLNKL